MGKGRRNQRNVDYYKVQGGAIEDRDAGRAAKQKLSRQKRRSKKVVPDVHPATPRRVAAPKRKPAAKTASPIPAADMPSSFTGAALSRLGGLTRRVLSAAESGVQVVRWAVDMARGRKRAE
jgi:hypothetical protein